MPSFDHFTPLSRALASIDRDAYAERFAIYDREYKALLRRLASADAPVSDADLAREEQAFRDAIRRIEFADDDAGPTLVPQQEPVAEEPPAQPREPLEDAGERVPSSSVPSLNVSSLNVSSRSISSPSISSLSVPSLSVPSVSVSSLSVPSRDQLQAGASVEPVVEPPGRRSVTRRLAERLALAVVVLILAGVGFWMQQGRQVAATEPPSDSAAAQSSEPAAADNAPDPKSQQPTWMSPQMFYYLPPMPAPVAPAAPALSAPAPVAPALRGDVPLPVPRPEN